MNTFKLQRRDGSFVEITDLSNLVNDNRLCTELFGTSAVPRNMSTSKTISWADGLFRERRRVALNMRAIWQEYKARYEADEEVHQGIAGRD